MVTVRRREKKHRTVRRVSLRTEHAVARYLSSLLSQPLSGNERVHVGRPFRGLRDQLIAAASSAGATVEATWIGEGRLGDWTGLPDDAPMVRVDAYYPDRPDRDEPHWTACTRIDARTSPRALAALCLAAARAIGTGLRRQFLARVSHLTAEDIAALRVPRRAATSAPPVRRTAGRSSNRARSVPHQCGSERRGR